mmetsp:Transcript_60348/g.113928  ORF Transcript_60348/g.113928 Transcript_60348/m.113928 type:complete len:303 (-) Transcript_60348:72-980(-)
MMKSACFAAAGGTIGAVMLARYLRVKEVPSEPKLSVMTFNVLARPYTKYNQKFHRVPGDFAVEDVMQTRARYTLAAEEITSKGNDIVFLQECEAAFFDSSWNPAAPKLLDNFHVFACRKKKDNVEQPGTAVLVQKAGRATATATQPICIGYSPDGQDLSKVATIIPMQFGGKAFEAVSTHFTWDGDAASREHHAQLVGEGLKNAKSVVFGGDFNSQPGVSLEQLESKTFLGGLRRAALDGGDATGLYKDFSRTEYIDHIYASRDWSPLSSKALRKPSSPWDESGKVTTASDHVPVVVELKLT